MKKIKRMLAAALAGAMCISAAGCGKKKSAAKDQLDYYKTSLETSFEYTVNDVIANEESIYCNYGKYSEDGGEEQYESGIIKYDINSKQSNSVAFDNSIEGYVDRFHFNKEGNIEVVYSEHIVIDPKTGESISKEELYASESSTSRDVETANDDGIAAENAEAAGDSADDGENTSAEDAANRGETSDEGDVSGKEENVDIADKDDYEYQSKETTYIYTPDLELVSKSEGEIKTIDYDDASEEMIYSEVSDGDGNVVSLKGNSDNNECSIVVTDSEGNESKQIHLDNLYGGELLKLNNGMLLLQAWGENGEELYPVDIESGKLGKRLADDSKFYNMSGIYSGRDNTVLINSDGFLFNCDCENGTITKILKFIDSDLNPDDVRYVIAVDENSYCVVLSSYETQITEINLLTKQAKEDTVKKEEVHLATLYLDDNVKQKVLNFNKTNEKYKIVIDEYVDMTSDDDDAFKNALNRFNADIAAGTNMDIICVDYNWQNLASKGAFEDWTPFLEKDADISESDFVESIVSAYKVNGKIYVLPEYYMINALIGASSKVGTDTTWTISEFVDYVKSLPEGVEVLDSLTSDMLLDMMLSRGFGEYIDWNAGTCDFNNNDFISLLELCKNYQSSEEMYADYEEEDWINEQSTYVKIRNNKVMLDRLRMDSVDEYLVEKLVFDEPVTVKGYPGSKGNGIGIETMSGLLAIGAKSKHKDVAWEFIKQFYTFEEQTRDMWEFPVRKDALDKLFEETQNRELTTAPDGTKYYSEYGIGDISFYIGNPTDEDIEEIKELIDRADTISSYDEEIFNMVTEETDAFFKGEKSATEVAEVIQSRASVYVKENK